MYSACDDDDGDGSNGAEDDLNDVSEESLLGVPTFQQTLPISLQWCICSHDISSDSIC